MSRLKRLALAWKNLWAVACLLTLATACHDGGDAPPTIVLTVENRSEVSRLLSWTELNHVTEYKVWRDIDHAELLATVDFLTLEYSDDNIPLETNIEYYITATIDGTEVRSNTVSVMGGSVFYIHPYQMKLLPEQNLAVVRDYTTVFLIDYARRLIVGRREFASTLGAFDLGTFKGKKELYVPCGDHNVYIMDPYTLTMIDTLNVNSTPASVVVNSMGRMYVCTDGFQTPIRLYNRATLEFQAQYVGELGSTLLLQSDNRVLAVSRHIDPATMSIYTFDDAGTLLSKTDDPYGWHYEMDPDRVKMSSKYIVTSTQGFVYKTDDMTWVKTLKDYGSDLTDFEFSATEGTVYAAISSKRSILKYTLGGNTGSPSIDTSGYPWIMVRNGDEMIVLSSPTAFSPSATTNKVFLERVDLK
jgi:hypothetical protein